MHKERLAGWGNYPQIECTVTRIETQREVTSLLPTREQNEAPAAIHCLARGKGRSYGDAALLDDGAIVDCVALNRYHAFEAETGTLTCEAGVTLEMLLEDFGPRGFMPMITPGTKYVTLGGCIANDVHGKAHHVDGSFARCVDSFRILLANGEVVNASPDEHADLFWACFGGMGLLGIIIDVTLRLRPVETMYFVETPQTIARLDDFLTAFAAEDQPPYSVAWVDSLAKGEQLGRGVLRQGRHAVLEDLPLALRTSPLKLGKPARITVPFEMPSAALNTTTIRLLNFVLNQMQKRGGPIEHYDHFFYPLDSINHWNRGYGPRGFAQYQFVIPIAGGREPLVELMQMIAESGQAPFLNVLKRFGPEHPSTQLSFPMEGYTFAVDFPVRSGLAELLHALDERVADMGGRVYLGKDAFLSRPLFERMYPKLDAWREVKAKYDPQGMFASALGRRLGLCT